MSKALPDYKIPFILLRISFEYKTIKKDLKILPNLIVFSGY